MGPSSLGDFVSGTMRSLALSCLVSLACGQQTALPASTRLIQQGQGLQPGQFSVFGQQQQQPVQIPGTQGTVVSQFIDEKGVSIPIQQLQGGRPQQQQFAPQPQRFTPQQPQQQFVPQPQRFAPQPQQPQQFAPRQPQPAPQPQQFVPRQPQQFAPRPQPQAAPQPQTSPF